ncbi:MAG: type II toxin-antitoxin system PemK/MazF family toxin [Chlamydiae bacterium]|nr:type II toxin-antitoxin system PemK/MazF family toxin [Chlamydiota bacterium]MBI3276505.1 type II toxin-antitoxin system PemK/MazF family toxin [Chlamydiota bacterium]
MRLEPSRGEIWFVDLNPTRGHEQSGIRPCLIVSVNPFNRGPAGLVIALPISSKEKGIPLHVPITPPEGGLKKRSFVKCEDMRSISKDRLVKCTGSVSSKTLSAIQDRLQILLGL